MARQLRRRRRAHEDGEESEQHEINVTPFIDIMLVLLIVFMVAAPLATVSLPVTLPRAATGNPLPSAPPLSLVIARDATLSLDGAPLAPRDLEHRLDAASHGDHERRILLGADRDIGYGRIMATLDRLGAAGYRHVGLVAVKN